MRRALIALACVAASSPHSAFPTAAERTLLQDWTFARCIHYAAKDQPIGDDAAKSAAALLERSQSGIDVFERIDTLIGPALSRKLGGSAPSNYDVLKCVELKNSVQLERVISRARRP